MNYHSNDRSPYNKHHGPGELQPRTRLETATAPTTRMGWEMRTETRFEESPPLKQKTKDVIICPRKQAEPCVLCAKHPQLISSISTGEPALHNTCHVE